jgi:hypothetical protein
MILDAGNFLRYGKKWANPNLGTGRKVSSAYLSWEFGWSPLISDLVKCLDIAEQTRKRILTIQKLKDSGLHRKFTYWEDDSYQWQGPFYPVNLYGTGLYLWCYVNTHRKRWVSMTWRPKPELYAWGEDETASNALRAVTGLYWNPDLLWDAMPWSWLVNWFTNAGDIVHSDSDLIPAEAGDFCWMENTKTTIDHFDIYNGNPQLSVTHIGGRFETKYRSVQVSGPSLDAHLPFLNGWQLSILASLAIQRV